MAEYIVKILLLEQVTHDVKRFRIEKPAGFSFIPGQATDVSINKPEFLKKKRTFSFTCLNSDPYLEFTIKIYPAHNGVTKELEELNPGDELIIRDPWGTIAYKGKGTFIAGGAGITPFIAVFRNLQVRNELEGNVLLFANRSEKDIIMKEEFRQMIGNNFHNVLSDEKTEEYAYGFPDQDFLSQHIQDINQMFYVCGPPPMMKLVLNSLNNMGVSSEKIVKETF